MSLELYKLESLLADLYLPQKGTKAVVPATHICHIIHVGETVQSCALTCRAVIKALANEDTLLRTHCCRHKCFPVCPCTQQLLRTQKIFLILFKNILCPQQMFPSLRNVMSNNVSATMFPQQCFLVCHRL